MKKLLLSTFLSTALIVTYGQAKTPPKKPFEYVANEAETNRIFFLISQLKAVIPKSKMPFDDGVAIITNADTAIANIQQQYNAWVASQKKDSTGKK